MNDNPYNVNCLGVFGENFQSKEFAESLELISEDQVGVYCFHDICGKTFNVHLSVDEFEKVLEIIAKNNLEVCKFMEMH